jgi:hypothetical protein
MSGEVVDDFLAHSLFEFVQFLQPINMLVELPRFGTHISGTLA